MISTQARLVAMIESEVRDRWERRNLYRLMSWTDWYRDNRVELRVLVSLLRRARRLTEGDSR